jgi:hypothetical protein
VTDWGRRPSNRSPVPGSSADTRGTTHHGRRHDMMGRRAYDALAIGAPRALSAVRDAIDKCRATTAVRVEHTSTTDGSSSHRRSGSRGSLSIRTPRDKLRTEIGELSVALSP